MFDVWREGALTLPVKMSQKDCQKSCCCVFSVLLFFMCYVLPVRLFSSLYIRGFLSVNGVLILIYSSHDLYKRIVL